MKDVLSSLLPLDSLVSQVFNRPIIFSLSLLIFICTLLYFAKAIFSRRVLVIIDETRISIDTNYQTLIQELCEKHFKVSYKKFTGEPGLTLEISASQYHKVVVLAGINGRRQDYQTQLYQDLHNIWRKDLIIFYLDSEGIDYSLTDFQAAQVSLCLRDYSKKAVNDNLEVFFNIKFFEEFRKILCFCIIGCFISLFFCYIQLPTLLEELVDNNQTCKENDHPQLSKNAAESLEHPELKILTNHSVSLSNSTNIIQNDSDNSTFETLNDHHNQRHKNATPIKGDSSERTYYGGLGENDKECNDYLNHYRTENSNLSQQNLTRDFEIFKNEQTLELLMLINNQSKQIEELKQDSRNQGESCSKQIEELKQSSQEQNEELKQSSQEQIENCSKQIEELKRSSQEQNENYLKQNEEMKQEFKNLLEEFESQKFTSQIRELILILCLLIASYNWFIYSVSSAFKLMSPS